MRLKTTTLWASALILILTLVLAAFSILLAPDDGFGTLGISLATEALLALCAILALQFLRGRAADMAAVAQTVDEITSGTLDAPAPTPSRWQELAILGAAVETLRQSQRDQARMKADAVEQLAVAEAARAQMKAISRSQAVIEFDPQGVVLCANDNFCRAMGYDAATIVGRRHAEFVDPDYARSPDYDVFWRDLRAGKLSSGEVRRRTRSGEAIWLSVTYNPIIDDTGKVIRIIKFAMDVTQRRKDFDQIVSALVRLSEGDLTARVPDNTSSEFAGLRDSFNATMERLQAMVSDISTTCDAMASESDRIAKSAGQLSERSDSQAAAVQETSAAVEEIAATIRQNAANASQAEAAAGEMAQRADAGARILEDAVGAMGRIEKSSEQISDIISVIESIAFQTNLLALNAAVEAARAGDAGKGFAVVASEVRTLAQRSSTAAKDISDLIRDATTQIASGSVLVRQSGQAFAEINGNVNGVVNSVTEISNASREQAAGVTEISTAIAQIDGTTQENANLSDQSSANARTLVDKTNDLRQLVGFFRGGSRPAFVASIPDYDTPAPRAVAAPAPRSAPRSSAATAAALDDWQDF